MEETLVKSPAVLAPVAAAHRSRTRERRATVACVLDTASLPPSDIGDWAFEEDQKETAGWRGEALRRARSWMAGAPQGLSMLPGRLGIASYNFPRINLRNIGERALRKLHDTTATHACSDEICEAPPSFARTYDTLGGEGYWSDDEKPTAGSLPLDCSGHGQKGRWCVDSKSHYGSLPGSPGDKEEEQTGEKMQKRRDSWTAKETVVVAKCEGQRRQLMSVFQIPAFMVEDYIMGSYRPLCFSYRECLQSWGYVHSELGNIMTHLVGAIIFICLALITGPFIIPAVGRKRPQDAPRVNYADYAVVYTYLAAVLFCLLASVAFHTLACHSPSRHFRSLRCDFIGILVLIAGSFVPMLYYGFFHSQKILISYMVMILALAAAGVAVSIAGRVEDPRRQAWRPVIFMGISVSGLIPLVHGVVINGYSGAVGSMSLWYVVGMGILYIAGTSVYAFKIPERYRPGKHNVLLQSHQIFHTFVVLAALCHFIGIVRALMWTHRVT